MTRVLISAPYLQREFEPFSAVFEKAKIEVVMPAVEERMDEAALLEHLPGCEGIICGDDRLSAKVIDAMPQLKVIVKWGTGIDSIDKLHAAKRGIPVCNTPGAFTEPVSETTIANMLAFARKIMALDRIVKNGGWYKECGFTLAECTLGIIGFGNIGKAVARKLKAFNNTILVNDIRPTAADEAQRLGVKHVDLDTLLTTADIITLHCDLNPTSHHLINTTTLAKMKQGAFLINTARGPVIHEQALIQALQNQHLAGAALDVFENEPLPLDSPLRKMEQVVLSAHACNASPKMWREVHKNSIRMLFEGLGIQTKPQFPENRQE